MNDGFNDVCALDPVDGFNDATSGILLVIVLIRVAYYKLIWSFTFITAHSPAVNELKLKMLLLSLTSPQDSIE